MNEPAYRLSDAALLATCDVDTFRAKGPGGQHVNRTDSAVRITHRATGVMAQCQDHRERLRNQRDALVCLRLRLALHIRDQSDIAWVASVVKGGRITIGPNAELFPSLVAVIMDALHTHAAEPAAAAQTVKCTASQLVKILFMDKDVLQAAQALRAQHGKGSLHGR